MVSGSGEEGGCWRHPTTIVGTKINVTTKFLQDVGVYKYEIFPLRKESEYVMNECLYV